MSNSKTNVPIVKWVGRAVCIALLGILLVEVVLTIGDVVLATDTVQGRMKSLRVINNGPRYNSGLHIEYEYVVDGIDYTAKRIWPGWLGNFITSQRGGQVAMRIPDEDVIVHFNPDWPTQAYLFPEIHRFTLGIILDVWGIALMMIMMSPHGHGPKLLRNAGWAIAFVSIGTGVVMVFFDGPRAIPVTDLDRRAVWPASIAGALFLAFTVLRHFEVPPNEQDNVVHK